jgi:hypothetical protein
LLERHLAYSREQIQRPSIAQDGGGLKQPVRISTQPRQSPAYHPVDAVQEWTEKRLPLRDQPSTLTSWRRNTHSMWCPISTARN